MATMGVAGRVLGSVVRGGDVGKIVVVVGRLLRVPTRTVAFGAVVEAFAALRVALTSAVARLAGLVRRFVRRTLSVVVVGVGPGFAVPVDRAGPAIAPFRRRRASPRRLGPVVRVALLCRHPAERTVPAASPVTAALLPRLAVGLARARPPAGTPAGGRIAQRGVAVPPPAVIAGLGPLMATRGRPRRPVGLWGARRGGALLPGAPRGTAAQSAVLGGRLCQVWPRRRHWGVTVAGRGVLVRLPAEGARRGPRLAVPGRRPRPVGPLGVRLRGASALRAPRWTVARPAVLRSPPLPGGPREVRLGGAMVVAAPRVMAGHPLCLLARRARARPRAPPWLVGCAARTGSPRPLPTESTLRGHRRLSLGRRRWSRPVGSLGMLPGGAKSPGVPWGTTAHPLWLLAPPPSRARPPAAPREGTCAGTVVLVRFPAQSSTGTPGALRATTAQVVVGVAADLALARLLASHRRGQRVAQALPAPLLPRSTVLRRLQLRLRWPHRPPPHLLGARSRGHQLVGVLRVARRCCCRHGQGLCRVAPRPPAVSLGVVVVVAAQRSVAALRRLDSCLLCRSSSTT